MRRAALLIAPLAAAAIGSGCGSSAPSTTTQVGAATLPTGAEAVTLDPADFTTAIDNPYWPMPPGRTWTFRETDGDGASQTVTVSVTDRTVTLMGIEARVVHDVVTRRGAFVEVTDDFYAQDRDGNVWYLGEDTKEYKDGRIASTEGSWRAGVGGAQPGIAVPGSPSVGLAYRQEYLAGQAEDAARVLSVDERVEVPQGRYDRVLMTKDFTPLEPRVLEHKFYARGVGPVLAVQLSGGAGREELVSVSDR